MFWSGEPSGQYSVKSGYRLAMTVLVECNNLHVEGDWHQLWKLEVPPRVKFFAWRACMDCLPSRTKLQQRGIQCSSFCVVCDKEMENLWHLLLTCQVDKEVWRKLNLWVTISPFLVSCESFKELFFKVLAVLDVGSQAVFVMGIGVCGEVGMRGCGRGNLSRQINIFIML